MFNLLKNLIKNKKITDEFLRGIDLNKNKVDLDLAKKTVERVFSILSNEQERSKFSVKRSSLIQHLLFNDACNSWFGELQLELTEFTMGEALHLKQEVLGCLEFCYFLLLVEEEQKHAVKDTSKFYIDKETLKATADAVGYDPRSLPLFSFATIEYYSKHAINAMKHNKYLEDLVSRNEKIIQEHLLLYGMASYKLGKAEEVLAEKYSDNGNFVLSFLTKKYPSEIIVKPFSENLCGITSQLSQTAGKFIETVVDKYSLKFNIEKDSLKMNKLAQSFYDFIIAQLYYILIKKKINSELAMGITDALICQISGKLEYGRGAQRYITKMDNMILPSGDTQEEGINFYFAGEIGEILTGEQQDSTSIMIEWIDTPIEIMEQNRAHLKKLCFIK